MHRNLEDNLMDCRLGRGNIKSLNATAKMIVINDLCFLCAHLELAQPIPRPCLSGKLPKNDPKTEDVTFGAHASQ